MRFVVIPLRHLARHPLRTALTVGGVAVAVAGFSVLTGLARGVEQAWSRSLVGQGTQVLGYRRGVLDLLTGALDLRLAEAVRGTPGVEAVAAELVDVLALESGGTLLVRGWEEGSGLWQATRIVAGRLPAATALDEAVVGEGLAATLAVEPGDELQPFGETLRIVGVVRMDGALSNHSLVMPLPALQRLLEREGKITVLHVRVAGGEERAARVAVLARLNAAFPQLVFVEARSAAEENDLFRFWRGAAWAASAVGLAMGLLVVVNTLLVAVLERTREIGVLVAVGWTRRRILASVVLESLLLTIAGGLFGIALGHVGLELLAGQPRLRGFVVVAPSLAAVAQQLAAAVSIGVGAGLYPAWRALRLDPVEVLRDA